MKSGYEGAKIKGVYKLWSHNSKSWVKGKHSAGKTSSLVKLYKGQNG